MKELLKKQIIYQNKIKELIEKGPTSEKQKGHPVQYMAYLAKELSDVSRKIEDIKLVVSGK